LAIENYKRTKVGNRQFALSNWPQAVQAICMLLDNHAVLFHDKVFLRLPNNKKLVDILNQFQTFATISTAQTA
jgi:hypothetical protein